MALWVLGLLLLVLMGGGEGGTASQLPGNCEFPAIYNFGDNNSDTGEHAAMFADLGLPNGRTFFGEPSGRYCDGRLIIDFIAEHLGFPFLSSYLYSYKTDYRHGVNFAVGGSSIRLAQSYSHFNLERQAFQLAQFTSRVATLYNQLGYDSKNQSVKSILPKAEFFNNSLFTLDVGQNDFAFDFENSTAEDARKAIPGILQSFSLTFMYLHEWFKGRFFWIHNVGPVGCLPYFVKSCQKKNPGCALDQNGCAKELNEVIQEYNKQLNETVKQLRSRYTNATFTLVDMYSAKYNLIRDARKLGFEDPMKFCCGSYEDCYVACGRMNSNATACDDPSKFISWDGLHYTEAANQIIAREIISGAFSDPPLPLKNACRSQV